MEERISSLTIDGSRATSALAEIDRGFESVARSAGVAGGAIEAMERDAARLTAANRDTASALTSTAGALASTTERVRESNREWLAIERSIRGSSAAAQRFTEVSAAADRALAAGRITAADHAQAIAGLRSKYLETGAAATQMAAETQRAADMARRFASSPLVNDNAVRSVNNLRGAIGQVGYQIQDISVQLAGGQNPFLVLSQQGSQIAGAFGPAGAAIGAVVAIAGAGAMALGGFGREAQELAKAADAAKASTSALDLTLQASGRGADDLAAKYRVLSGEMREVERVSMIAAQRKMGEEASALRTATDGQVRALEARRAAFEASQRQITAGTATADPARLDDFATMRDTFAALDRYKAGGAVSALVGDLQRLADRGGATAEPLEATASAMSELAKKSADLEERQRRLDASMRLLDGTAAGVDRTLLDFGEAAGRAAGGVERLTVASERARAGASIFADERKIREEIAALQAGERAVEEFRRRRDERSIWGRTYDSAIKAGESTLDATAEANRLARLERERQEAATRLSTPPRADVQEMFSAGQSGRWLGGEWEKDAGRLDKLTTRYEAERSALAALGPDREARIAGLRAEWAALDRGVTASMAREERLLAEARALDQVALARRDADMKIEAEISEVHEVGSSPEIVTMFEEAFQ